MAQQSDPGTGTPNGAASVNQGDATGEARLAALLADLETLQQYLDERGRHTYALAQRFIENARRDASARAYDERQATMLEYQHYIWHEIAGRVGQLLSIYGEAPTAADRGESTSAAQPTTSEDA